jgi:4-oxalocrotonate tautomerase
MVLEALLFMPLVKIHLMQGKPAEFRRKLGEVVYQTMMDTINVPPKDNFQIITEHDKENWSLGNGIAQSAE